MTVKAIAIIVGILALVTLADQTWPGHGTAFGAFGGWLSHAIWYQWRKLFSASSR